MAQRHGNRAFKVGMIGTIRAGASTWTGAFGRAPETWERGPVRGLVWILVSLARVMGFLFDRPARVLLLVLATVLVFCVGAGRLRVDNSPAVWLPTQDPELDLYRNFRERFGEDTFLLAASGRREQAPSVFERMGAVAERVETLAGVDRVESPAIPGPDPVAGAGSTSGLLVGRERLALLVLPRGDLTDSQRKALVDELRATLAGEFGDLGPWELLSLIHI